MNEFVESDSEWPEEALKNEFVESDSEWPEESPEE